MKKTITIFHNPRCSKSRDTLAIVNKFIEQHSQFQLNEIRYLENPPSFEQLHNICQQLKIKPSELIRSGEKLFKELGFSKQDLKKDDDQLWLKLMADHPKLIERPIVQADQRAIIGRPPEKVEPFLQALNG